MGATPAAAQEKKPNIVFILADDFGYADLKCYGHPYARTPNLDKLATEGTRFTQFYMTGITCCPSRTGLMTGKFPATFREYPAGAGFGKRVTVTELLKKQGYATGHFGKWHIGPKQTPGTYGIDAINATDGDERAAEASGRARARRQHLRRRDHSSSRRTSKARSTSTCGGTSATSRSTRRRRYVDRFKDLTVKEADFSPYMQREVCEVRKTGGDVNDGMRRYLADVESMDESVGRLLKKLDDLGLRDNTIVVFSSDQGPAPVELPARWTNLPPAEKTAADRATVRTCWATPASSAAASTACTRAACASRSSSAGRAMFPPIGSTRPPSSAASTGSPRSAASPARRSTPRRSTARTCRASGSARTASAPGRLFWKTNNVRSDIAIRDGKWKLFYPTRNRGETELYDLSVDRAREHERRRETPRSRQGNSTAKVEKWKATLPKDNLKSNDND